MKTPAGVATSEGWTLDSLAELLAPALGRERSAALIAATAARLGLSSAQLNDVAAVAIIEQLSEGSSLVAVSARFARARIGHRRTAQRRASSLPPEWIGRTKAPPAAADKPAARRSWQLSEIAGLLANAVGKERSLEVVRAEVERLELSEPLDAESVQQLLDGISKAGGIVGTAAQFAKSRLMLRKQPRRIRA